MQVPQWSLGSSSSSTKAVPKLWGGLLWAAACYTQLGHGKCTFLPAYWFDFLMEQTSAGYGKPALGIRALRLTTTRWG